jgi:hypothetical protein
LKLKYKIMMSTIDITADLDSLEREIGMERPAHTPDASEFTLGPSQLTIRKIVEDLQQEMPSVCESAARSTVTVEEVDADPVSNHDPAKTAVSALSTPGTANAGIASAGIASADTANAARTPATTADCTQNSDKPPTGVHISRHSENDEDNILSSVTEEDIEKMKQEHSSKLNSEEQEFSKYISSELYYQESCRQSERVSSRNSDRDSTGATTRQPRRSPVRDSSPPRRVVKNWAEDSDDEKDLKLDNIEDLCDAILSEMHDISDMLHKERKDHLTILDILSRIEKRLDVVESRLQDIDRNSESRADTCGDSGSSARVSIQLPVPLHVSANVSTGTGVSIQLPVALHVPVNASANVPMPTHAPESAQKFAR